MVGWNRRCCFSLFYRMVGFPFIHGNLGIFNLTQTHCKIGRVTPKLKVVERPADNVVEFEGMTTVDLDLRKILKNLSEETDIEHCLVFTLRKDGEETYHSTTSDIYAVNYWADLIKQSTL